MKMYVKCFKIFNSLLYLYEARINTHFLSDWTFNSIW